jgi:hypothetical protein
MHRPLVDKPGRACPLNYRYPPAALARDPALEVDPLYVFGGLYGNLPALEAALELAAREPGAAIVFNGDFHWFDADGSRFEAVDAAVQRHAALRGNVETELASDGSDAGCGCAYPAWVDDAEVERSNRILARLRRTARGFPARRARLATLPMHLAAVVGGLRVAIVHGDVESLAGWRYAQQALADPAHAAAVAGDFGSAGARIIASSHTCLPVAAAFDTAAGGCALINNGAAGMPNFRGTRHGVITRIATAPAAAALYGIVLDGVHVEALALRYDAARFERQFLEDWPPGSDAYVSYYRRLRGDIDYTLARAVRGGVKIAA